MGVTYDEADRLFRLGEFVSLISSANLATSALRGTEPRQRVLLAQALALTGDLARARQVAQLDLESSNSLIRSHAESTFGLVDWRSGDMTSALQHLQSAVRLAQASADAERSAWAHLHLFRFLIDGHPTDALTAMLPDVRRVVVRAGSAQAAAYLHACVSVLAGQGGRLDEARQHCEVAESLLRLSPNAWILGNSLLNRACVECLECNFEQAYGFLRAAKETLGTTGHSRSTAVLDSTLGYLRLLTGQFEKAEHSLCAVLNDPRTPAAAKIAPSETLARVYLAQDRLQECEGILDSIDSQANRYPAKAIYHRRWATLTRARLLIRRQEYLAAIVWLERIEHEAHLIRDVPFTAALHLVTADALSNAGEISAAAARLVMAVEAGSTQIRELQAQYYCAAALVVPKSHDLLSQHLHDRAVRLWRAQGIVSIRLEMQRPGVDKPSDSEPSGRSNLTEKRQPVTVQCVTNSLSAVIDLAHSPQLLGAELLTIVRALDCSPDARLVETRLNSPDDDHSETHVVVPLGTAGRKKIALVCPVPDEPLKAVLLGDVLRVARAALALERARQDERARAALWPASPVEEQAGALFLAEEMQSLLTTVRRIAPTSVPVLITGETGTGKEVLARLVHAYSPRAQNAFVPFNCTATPKDMLDAQLFGYRRGAFTGATDHFPGVIRAAAGGTLFLDEIGETTLDVQPKLLRFLEAGEVHPIGEVQPVRVDVRVIAATNADLDALVAQARFREDLFYRLNIVRLHVPPLRERRVEIPALANHYLQKHAQEYGKGELRLAEDTMEYLVLYRWPGNVRQLANEMRRMAALAEAGAVLMPEHLSGEIAASRRTIPASERMLDPTEVVVRLDQPMAAAVEHVERSMMLYALRKCGGRMEETAALLGLSRKGLYLKRQRFDLEPPEAKVRSADVA